MAFNNGFGVETDIRDCNGALVISHDPPTTTVSGESSFLRDIGSGVFSEPLALNIKADGLHRLVKVATAALPRDRFFVFDMSIPDTLSYLKSGIPVYLRHSEYEIPSPLLLSSASGIWLDCFTGIWFDSELIKSYGRCGLPVAIVSPELHGRDRYELWERLKSWGFSKDSGVMICTDHPFDARAYFHG